MRDPNFFRIVLVITFISRSLVNAKLRNSSWISTQNFTKSDDCAFLSATLNHSLKWKAECYHLNIAVKRTENSLDLGNDFRRCFSTKGLNVTYFDVIVRENCSLKLDDGVNQTVFNEGNHVNYTKIWNVTSLSVTSCLCGGAVKFQNSSEVPKVGIIFSPYDKHPEDCSELDTEKSCLAPIRKKHVNWWNYSKQEIQKQLELVAEKFSEISIYGVGTVEISSNPPTYNTDWRDGLPVALVPITVAEMNKKLDYPKLKIVVGAYSHDAYTRSHFQAEILNAIGAARDAETLFPGTVSGVSIQYNALSMHFADLVQEMLISARNYSPKGGRSGIRLEECDKAFRPLFNRTEESSHLYCKPSDRNCTSSNPLELNPLLESVINITQFLICFVRPQASLFTGQLNITMPDIIRSFGQHLVEMRKALEKVNPEIELVVETGWPSQGTSRNGSPNSLKNMKQYWMLMVEWAKLNGIRIFMFEAFDEPWKTDLTLQAKNESGGVCGSEDHYGLWRRKDNSDPAVYEMKLDIQDDEEYSTIESGYFSEECRLEESSETRPGKLLMISITIAAIIFILLVIGLGYMAIRLKVVKKNSNSQLSQRYLEIFRQGMDSKSAKIMPENDDDYQIIALQFPYDKRKYEMGKGSFKIDLAKPIGKGQSGTVYLGEVFKTQVDGYVGLVAFKSSDSSSSILDIKNFLSEIKIMSYIGEHENIISLIGAYTEKLERGIVHLALEYCPLGSLDKFLQGNGKLKSSNYAKFCLNDGPTLNYVTTACLDGNFSSSSSFSNGGGESICDQPEFDFQTMVIWSWQIANGMEHLSGKKVIHADMACRNILLTSDMSIKITDFGLSQKLYSEISPNLVFESDVALPWRWMAPESLRKLVFSTESDVYSFGTTLWEIFSLGNVPFAGEVFCSQFVQDLEDGKRLNEPRLATDELLDIMDECWSFCPSDRPNFTTLKDSLARLL